MLRERGRVLVGRNSGPREENKSAAVLKNLPLTFIVNEIKESATRL